MKAATVFTWEIKLHTAEAFKHSMQRFGTYTKYRALIGHFSPALIQIDFLSIPSIFKVGLD